MLYTVSQAHEYLNGAIGINSVRDKMRSGEIPSTFDGKKYITTEKQLDNYIKKINAEIEIQADKYKNIYK